MAERPERIKLTKSSYQKARKVLAFMRPYAGIYSIGWFFLLFSSITAMLFPALMGQLLGANDQEAAMINVGKLDFTSINVILTALLVTFGVQAFFSFFRVVIFNQVTENALRDLKQASFDKL